jgi:hypothetical protein
VRDTAITTGTTTAPRFTSRRLLKRLDSLQWWAAVDTILQRPVAMGEAAPGAFLFLKALASVYDGMERVLQIGADAASCIIDQPPHPPKLLHLRAQALLACGQALQHIHSAGLSLGPARQDRLPPGEWPCVRLAGLPLLGPGDAAQLHADRVLVWDRSVHSGVVNGAAPPDMDTLLSALHASAERARSEHHRAHAHAVWEGSPHHDEMVALRNALRA